MNVAIINLSSKLIKQENPALVGLLTIVGTGTYIGDGRLFHQILTITDSHWIMMPNVLTGQCNVSIYDSAQRLKYKRESKDIRYKVSIKLDACSLRACPENKLTIFVEDTQQVKKESDSGIAAIMFALAIARHLDPQKINFNYKLLCRKLLHCFEELSFNSTTFNDSPCRHWKRKFEFTVPLYCHCNKPDLGDHMIKCDTCDKWYHVSYEDGDFQTRDWKCMLCSTSEKEAEVHDTISHSTLSHHEQTYTEV